MNRQHLGLSVAGCSAILSVGFVLTARAPASAGLDLTGQIPFDVSSMTGRVENIAVQVGDGGRGSYAAILAGDSTLPTHTLYHPRDLSPFGDGNPLPVVAFANGGCRASSGEFRNMLSDIASYGYLVVAIGPAGTSAVAGGESPMGASRASQLLDGLDWATKENARNGSQFYRKLDTSKFAVAGQSCGGVQALEVSGDPRVATSIILNSSAGIADGNQVDTLSAEQMRQMLVVLIDRVARRYVPYAPAPEMQLDMFEGQPADRLQQLHAPVLYVHGGVSDIAYGGAQADFEAINNVPIVMMSQDVGHYPATYREPHGGDFAVAVRSWLDWRLKGDQSAKAWFVGADCGFCRGGKWTVAAKNVE